MRRLLNFLLLGPVLGYIVFILRDIAGGRVFGGMIGLLFGLPFAYLFGLPIALLMWAEDALLWNKIGLWPKVTFFCDHRLRSKHRNVSGSHDPSIVRTGDSDVRNCRRRSGRCVFPACPI